MRFELPCPATNSTAADCLFVQPTQQQRQAIRPARTHIDVELKEGRTVQYSSAAVQSSSSSGTTTFIAQDEEEQEGRKEAENYTLSVNLLLYMHAWMHA